MLSSEPIGKGVTLEDGTVLPWGLFYETLVELQPYIQRELDNELLASLRKVEENKISS